jgi:hypothetical protein
MLSGSHYLSADPFTTLMQVTSPSDYCDSSIFPASAIQSSTLLTQPLVTVEQLDHHLGLLRAFRDLRRLVREPDVEACHYIPQLALQLDADARWSWFVGLGVERYVWLRDRME